MLFMNRWDIDETVARINSAETPNLYAAARTLQRLQTWTDVNSDGWAYWPKPARAATKLMTLLQQKEKDFREDGCVSRGGVVVKFTDATPAELKAAYTPIKAMLTRTGIKGANEAVFPTPPPTPAERLEYLRTQLRAECISTGELIELQGLADQIEPGDVELLEAAGVPEFPEPITFRVRWEIDIEASSPEEAAQKASDIMYSPSSLPPVFDVICGDPAVTVRIDTMELPV